MLSKIAYLLFRVNVNETKFLRRGFRASSHEARRHLETVGEYFLNGYHQSLKIRDSDKLCSSLNNEPVYFRGFAFEGAAMARTIVNNFVSRNRNALERILSKQEWQKHIYMLHVGVGWAYARLPVNIERKIKAYDKLLRWLIIDGYGFHEGYFRTKKIIYGKKVPRQLKTDIARHVFHQGVGRSLWFTEGADVKKISEKIGGFPGTYQGDMWAGIGLACGYAGGWSSISEVENLKLLSGKYCPELMQGVAFAVKARNVAGNMSKETILVCRLICNRTEEEVAAITDEVLNHIPSYLNSGQMYELWRKLIAESLKEEFHEPIF